MMARDSSPAAALVGVLPGVQGQGVWVGRRQILVRFAGQSETAVMYSAGALAEDLKRLVVRARFHSITLTGHHPLANAEFLEAALEQAEMELPIMSESDGQRPEAIRALGEHLAMVQVTLGSGVPQTSLIKAAETLAVAAELGLEHALVLVPRAGGTAEDQELLRMVDSAHAASERTAVIIHPAEADDGGPVEARWSTLLGLAAERHANVRLQRCLRVPIVPV